MTGSGVDRDLQFRPRLAFALHTPDIYHHYRSIMAALPEGSFDWVLMNQDPELQALAEQVGVKATVCWELIENQEAYQWLVSHHFHGSTRLSYIDERGQMQSKHVHLIKRLGRFNIRLLYGLGADHWHYDDWNRLYDAWLCLGPRQAERLRQFGTEVYQVGYPRYDDFFQYQQPQVDIEKLGCDPQRPTIVWFGTLGTWNCLALYAETLRALCPEYNVLVKPHPLSWQEEPEKLAGLEQGFTRLIREPLDNLLLYQIADFVISDYCGVPFSAIYTDCATLLLDHPDYPGGEDPAAHAQDTDLWLRQYLPHLGPDTIHELPELLRNQRFWERQKHLRAAIRAEHFAPYPGCSAQRAAEVLKSLMTTG